MINYFSNVLKPIILSGIIALFVGTYVFDLLDYEFRYIVLILLIIGIIAIVLIRKIDSQFPFVNSIIAF